MRLLGFVFSVIAIVGLLACDTERRTARTSVPPRGTGSRVSTGLPSAPVAFRKPRSLGPVTPPVVILPERISEPAIRVRITVESDEPPVVREGVYRGRVDIVRTGGGKYVAVNTLSLEDYVGGIAEMPGSWQGEAHKAQAIAARTYALFMACTEGSKRMWDVAADTSSQVYRGIAGETASRRRAAAATRGQVLMATVQGQTGIFCARYHACTGGVSQDPYDAWGDTSIPSLAARRTGDYDQACRNYTWGPVRVSKVDLTRAVLAWARRNDMESLGAMGSIDAVAVVRRNGGGRPVEVALRDARGVEVLMRAEELRLALLADPQAPKPPSSFCEYEDGGEAIVLVNGRGYGHGIGMSQWGAQYLATQGYMAEAILGFYYPQSEVRELW